MKRVTKAHTFRIPLPFSKVVSIAVADRASILAERDRLVETHLVLVRQIAAGILRGLPSGFELDDLIGAGNIGLLRAATVYRARPGIPFQAYARKVIRGYICDSVRRNAYKDKSLRVRSGGPGVCVDAPGMDRFASPAIAGEAALDGERTAVRVAQAVAGLPVRYRTVIQAYYGGGDLRLYELARQLEVTPGRASQLRSKAVEMLQKRLLSA